MVSIASAATAEGFIWPCMNLSAKLNELEDLRVKVIEHREEIEVLREQIGVLEAELIAAIRPPSRGAKRGPKPKVKP